MAVDDLPTPRTEPTGTTSSDSSLASSESTEETRRARRPRPKHDFPETQAGKLWKAFENPPGGPVNEMPGGTYNTAGGKPRETSWRDAFRFDTMSNSSVSKIHTQPCARDSMLVGIGVGGGVGGLSFILRGLGGMWVTTNYAVGSFALASCGMFYWCQKRRRDEARGMAAAVAGMKMLHEKKAREELEEKEKLRIAEEIRKKAEDEQKRNKSRWKVW